MDQGRMKEQLPYGVWETRDRRMIYFNRLYEPLFEVEKKKVYESNPAELITGIVEEKWFYCDSNAPWLNESVFNQCLKMYEDLKMKSEEE